MSVDRKGFQGLVADVAADKAIVVEVCARFEPFFGIVEKGAYALRMPEQDLYRDATAAVKLLLADKAARICPFTVSRPYDAPTWMTDEIYVESIRSSLERDALGSEFLMRIVAGTESPVVRQRVVDAMKALDGAPSWKDLTQGINAAITKTFRSRLFDEGVTRSIQTGVQDFLRAYAAAALADARPWQALLTPLMTVLPNCIPFSRRSSASCKNVITLFA